MSRPRKNNADYFSHDNDMRNDEKILAIRRKFGHEGYSIWNMMLEKLCKCELFVFAGDNVSIELLSGDFMIDPERLSEMLDYFVSIRLLVREDEKIYSKKLIDRFSGLLTKRERDKNYRQGKLKNEELSPAKTPKVKYSKVKDNKLLEGPDGIIQIYERCGFAPLDSLAYEHKLKLLGERAVLEGYFIQGDGGLQQVGTDDGGHPIYSTVQSKLPDWKKIQLKVLDFEVRLPKAKREVKDFWSTMYKFLSPSKFV